jgi:hypothetical protein
MMKSDEEIQIHVQPSPSQSPSHSTTEATPM